MLIFLLLCCFIRTLRGAPLASGISDVTPRESPAPPDQPTRTIYSIIYSCLVTICACVWTSVHPNINGPRDSGWTCFKRKVTTMLCALIAPEFVLLWALAQHSAAKEIAKRYNDKFAKFEQRKGSIWKNPMDWFQPLPKETTRRSVGQPWTKTHGFFLQMGGFILYENDYPKEVLDYYRLAQLLRSDAIDAPTVTERELLDRSKGDAVTKGIILLQTTWFVLQCIARAAQKLPLSELEVLTLAFALVNGAVCAAWWTKPQGVEMAICVQLKKNMDEGATHVTQGVQEPSDQHEFVDLPLLRPASSSPHSDHGSVINNNAPMVTPNQHKAIEGQTGKQNWQWLRDQVRKDRESHTFFVFFVFRLPYRALTSVLHTFRKFMKLSIVGREELRVPVFFSEYMYALEFPEHGDIFCIVYIVGMLFGAVHLLPWALTSQFSSRCDFVLWRASAVILTVTPVVALFVFFADRVDKHLHNFFVFLLQLLIPIYVVARLVVIVVALRAIINPPTLVLVDVPWISNLPHL